MTCTRVHAYLCLLALCALPASTTRAFADEIPYPHKLTIAPQVNTFASGSDGIDVYFDGSGAGLNEFIAVYDVQTGYNSGWFFPGFFTALGTELTLGSGGQIQQGDRLVFFDSFSNTASLSQSLASDASLSADGYNHAYITTYSGGTVGSTQVPAGLYVGMEDLPFGGADWDYDDDSLIFVGVNAVSTVTPEPGSIALVGTGILLWAWDRRRRLKAVV